MDISKAALPPRQVPVSPQDRAHPLFPLYQQHRQSCAINLIEASSFCDWIYQYEAELKRADAAAKAEYPQFLAWMRTSKGGARRCPAGAFPHNFYYWLEGGRW